jgi:trimethylamine-N-oxide reductase (cytochrome c)
MLDAVGFKPSKVGSSFGAQDVTWLREIKTCKSRGLMATFHPIWINPEDALKRNAKNGDVVTVYNDRVPYSVVPMSPANNAGIIFRPWRKYDPIIPGELTEAVPTAPYLPQQPPRTPRACSSGFLVEVERTNLEELRKKYPEAFNRPFHATAGPGMQSSFQRRSSY